LTAAVLLLGLAASAQVAGGTKMASNDVKKCLKIQGNLLKKDISHKKRLKRSARRCGRL
jgi:phosphate-selective porin